MRARRTSTYITAAVLLMAASEAHAATLTVTTTADSQDGACTAALCSLRDAVAAAGSGDIVKIPKSSSVYDVALGEIQITTPLTIQGDGAGSSVISARSRSRIFHITSGVGTSE